jgi:multidrug efflux pump subunit AcrA (membrane-fusion protein)
VVIAGEKVVLPQFKAVVYEGTTEKEVEVKYYIDDAELPADRSWTPNANEEKKYVFKVVAGESVKTYDIYSSSAKGERRGYASSFFYAPNAEMSLGNTEVEFSVAERYAKDVKSGTNLTFTVDGFEEEFTASVYATESSLDAETHNLTVRALYPNTDGALMPGQYAGIKLKQKEIPDAISVPAEAIVPEMGKNKIFVYRNGFAEPVDVVTGLRTDAEVQIISGLQAGDTILTSGTLQLRRGSAVKLDKID